MFNRNYYFFFGFCFFFSYFILETAFNKILHFQRKKKQKNKIEIITMETKLHFVIKKPKKKKFKMLELKIIVFKILNTDSLTVWQ